MHLLAHNTMINNINPFPEEQLNLLVVVPKQAARLLIVLHPKQNIESELKWQTCFGTTPKKFSCSSGKRLIFQITTLISSGIHSSISNLTINFQWWLKFITANWQFITATWQLVSMFLKTSNNQCVTGATVLISSFKSLRFKFKDL